MEKRFLTASDVAEMLGRSEGAVRQMTYRQQLPYRRLGRRVVYLEKEILSMIDRAPGLTLAEV
jgi:predicted DNA-binding transcriptional regulator AlpA